MLAFLLHRLSGWAILFYLVMHIISMSYLAWGPEAFNHHMDFFQKPIFKVAEIALFAPVILHAFNGTRILLIDLFDLTKYQKQLFWGFMAAAAVAWVVMAVIMFQHADILQEMFGLKAAVGGHV